MPDYCDQEDLLAPEAEVINPVDIRLSAMNFLARREHSLSELRLKLLRRYPAGELLENELQRLVLDNLQSDERFAQSYARQRSSRGYGPLKIRQEMREKGLSDEQVAVALGSVDIDWFGLARDALHKKFGTSRPADIRDKARRARFMHYRGFSSDQYQHLLED